MKPFFLSWFPHLLPATRRYESPPAPLRAVTFVDARTALRSLASVTDVRSVGGHAHHPALVGVMETHKTYTAAEVAEHNNSKSCWMIIAGKVYAVERFLSEHPGGEDVLLETAGRDATREFEDVGHSKSARDQLNDFFIGDLVEEAAQGGDKVAEGAGGGARDGAATGNGATGEEFGGAFGRVPAAASAPSGGATLMLKRVAVPVLIALLVYLVRVYTAAQ